MIRHKKDKRDKKNCHCFGFTLLEVMVAIFIIIMGLGGALSLIRYTVSAAATSAARLLAANLAQEGIEVVRNIRDLNYGANGWNDWYNDPSVLGDHLVQYNSVNLRPFSETFLNYDASGYYSYEGSGTPTTYKRKITLTKSGAEITVVAEVTWSERGRSYSLVVEDRLWNWR